MTFLFSIRILVASIRISITIIILNATVVIIINTSAIISVFLFLIVLLVYLFMSVRIITNIIYHHRCHPRIHYEAYLYMIWQQLSRSARFFVDNTFWIYIAYNNDLCLTSPPLVRAGAPGPRAPGPPSGRRRRSTSFWRVIIAQCFKFRATHNCFNFLLKVILICPSSC